MKHDSRPPVMSVILMVEGVAVLVEKKILE
jgi:hypothetical protein